MLDVPVRPLNVKFLKPARRKTGKYLTVLLYGDSHHGYHCDKTLASVLAIGKDVRPDIVVDMGDGVDAGHLSEKFKQNPTRTVSLQDEINLKRFQLATFRDSLPNTDYWYLEGNHEERLRRVMWNTEGPAKELIKLDVVQRSLTWPKLLDLAALHISFLPYEQQPHKTLLPKFILKHGSIVRKNSGYTATGEMAKYNRSGASGHTHRLGVVWKRDLNGCHVWIETGCCCLLNPEYVQDPDWANGCVVLTFDTKTGAVQVEPVEIRDGHTIWRGAEYRA